MAHRPVGVLSLAPIMPVLMAPPFESAGCAKASPPGTLVLLTRDGCTNTATMRARLDAALDRLGLPMDYAVIDAATLAEGDVRSGYGTPTVLSHNLDLFGLPESAHPNPSPT